MTLVELLTNIANAIRSKTGETNSIPATEFPDRISAITVGNSFVITVSGDDGALVTATNGDETVTGTISDGSVALTVNSAGTWTISATLDDATSKITTVEIEDSFTAQVTFDDIYEKYSCVQTSWEGYDTAIKNIVSSSEEPDDFQWTGHEGGYIFNTATGIFSVSDFSKVVTIDQSEGGRVYVFADDGSYVMSYLYVPEWVQYGNAYMIDKNYAVPKTYYNYEKGDTSYGTVATDEGTYPDADIGYSYITQFSSDGTTYYVMQDSDGNYYCYKKTN